MDHKKKKMGPTQPLRHDELGDSLPDSWVEGLIIAVALFGILGGAVALYHLSTAV